MRSSARLLLLLVMGLVTLSGCAAVRSMLSGGSGPVSAPEDSSGVAVVAEEPTAPRFKLYDSWASW